MHALFFQTCMVLFSFFTVGLAFKCFQCNTVDHPKCDSLTSNDTNSQYYKECEDYNNLTSSFCRKVYTELTGVEDSARIFRTCGWIHTSKKRQDVCRKADTDFIKKRQCECFTEACNSSNKLKSWFTSLAVSATVFCLFGQLGVA